MALVTVEVVPSARGQKQMAELRKAFIDLGFQIGPTGPVSFSIVGGQEAFERTFTGINFSKSLPPQLSVTLLPKTLRRLVERMVFTTGYVPFGP